MSDTGKTPKPNHLDDVSITCLAGSIMMIGVIVLFIYAFTDWIAR